MQRQAPAASCRLSAAQQHVFKRVGTKTERWNSESNPSFDLFYIIASYERNRRELLSHNYIHVSLIRLN